MKKNLPPHLEQEFDRQVANLIEKKYPQAAKLSERDFLKLVLPLKNKLSSRVFSKIDLMKGALPFVIVIKSELVRAEKAMTLLRWGKKPGVTKLFPHTSKDFKTIAEVKIPKSAAYLLLDIDRGKKNINLPPNQAMVLIKKAKRQPLTIDEGIAIVAACPEFLIKNNCFSLLASRVPGNQRVPAIWINGQKQANLGWCWDGNPHTWLGSASCKGRVGATKSTI
jgi:hypothetical protein